MTKRLFAYFGLTMLGVYTVVFYFGTFGAVAAAGASLAIFISAFLAKQKDKAVPILIAVTIILSVIAFTVYDAYYKAAAEKYNGKTVNITASLTNEGQKRYGTYNYELKTSKINSQKVGIKVMLCSNYILPLEYGDTVKAKVRLVKCESDYYLSRRFVYTAESDNSTLEYEAVKADNKGLLYIPVFLRQKLTESVKRLVSGKEGELCAAVTFGAREQLSADVNRAFSDTGLSFLIVVSGLHVSIAAFFIMLILKPLKKRRLGNVVRCIAVILFISLYVGIVGYTASVIRAGFAAALTAAGAALSRKSDLYNNLGLAAVVLLIGNPYAVGDIGMLLSFSSVLGIVYFYPKLTARFSDAVNQRVKRYTLEIERTNQKLRIIRFKTELCACKAIAGVISLFFVSLSAVIGSMPVLLTAIGKISPVSLIASVILAPLVAVVIIFTLLSSIIYYIPFVGAVAFAAVLPAQIVARFMISLTSFISSIPHLNLYLDRELVGIWFLVTLITAGFALAVKKKRSALLAAAVFSLVFLISGYTAQYIIHSNSVTLRIINSGATTVKLSGGNIEALLKCSGDYGRMNQTNTKLRASCVDIDTLIVPDDSLRASRFAVNILDEFDVKSVLLYHSNATPLDLIQKAEQCREYDEFYGGDYFVLNLKNGIKDTIINDGESTWQYVAAKNTSVLIAPEKADAQNIDERYRSADILILNSKIKNSYLLDCSKAVWTSQKPVDQNLSNAIVLPDEGISIKIN